MRRLALAGAAALLAASAASAAMPVFPRKAWSGAGSTDLASEAANWVEGAAPKDGDRIVFGGAGTKDCRWDLDIWVSSLTLTSQYTGKVSLGAHRLRVAYNVRVANGVLDLEGGTLRVSRRLYVERKGTVQIGNGELLLGTEGLLVDNGGRLLSTGDKPARVTAAKDTHFKFVVGDGTIMLANPAGTTVEKSQGIVIYSAAEVEKAESVVMKEVAPGAAAVTVGAQSDTPVKLENWVFDESAATKVASAGDAKAAPNVVLTEAPAPPGELGAVRGNPRRWTGAAGNPSSADPANWDGPVPGPEDVAVFDSTVPTVCDWTADGDVGGLRLDPGFAGEVRLGTAKLRTGAVRVLGGRLDLEAADLRVSGWLSTASSGTLELGAATVRLGRGLRLDGGLLSSVSEDGPIVAPLDNAKPYAVELKAGRVRIASPGGTRFDGAEGVHVGAAAEVERLDRVFLTHLPKGAAGLTLARRGTEALTLSGWGFDASGRWNVDASQVPEGAAVVVAEATGAGAGSARQKDPSGVLSWEPDGGFEGQEPLAELQRERWSVTPLARVDVSGGQYFFEQKDGSLSGNFRVLASALVKHPERPEWTWQPLYSGNYRGTKQVTDLVGGGTLVQETMEHRLAARAIYQASPRWKVKPELAYKAEFLKETRDEDWGKGLFDQRRLSAGVEAEWSRGPSSFRLGWDYSMLSFPNYVSLESQAKGTQGLARELAGSRVLDSRAHILSLGGSLALPWRSFGEAGLTATKRDFPEQRVVDLSGQLTGSSRSDTVLGLGLDWRFPRQLGRFKVLTTAGLAWSRTDSTQNSYDAQRTRFLPDYYDASTLRASLDGTLMWPLSGKRSALVDGGLALQRTAYADRPVQEESGTYGTASVTTDATVLSARLRWPIAPHFHWSLSLQAARQRSNMAFEKLYRYNYDTVAYLTGFSWEY